VPISSRDMCTLGWEYPSSGTGHAKPNNTWLWRTECCSKDSGRAWCGSWRWRRHWHWRQVGCLLMCSVSTSAVVNNNNDDNKNKYNANDNICGVSSWYSHYKTLCSSSDEWEQCQVIPDPQTSQLTLVVSPVFGCYHLHPPLSFYYYNSAKKLISILPFNVGCNSELT